MPTFYFGYRGNEINAAVTASTRKEARRKLETGEDCLFVVNTGNLHDSMWTAEDDEGAPVDEYETEEE